MSVRRAERIMKGGRADDYEQRRVGRRARALTRSPYWNGEGAMASTYVVDFNCANDAGTRGEYLDRVLTDEESWLAHMAHVARLTSSLGYANVKLQMEYYRMKYLRFTLRLVALARNMLDVYVA